MWLPIWVDVFAAIADPVRRDLLRLLATRRARVVDLAAGRPISRPAVSRHLKVLADAGLVVADDVGRERHYRLRAEPLDTVTDLLHELAGPSLRPPARQRGDGRRPRPRGAPGHS